MGVYGSGASGFRVFGFYGGIGGIWGSYIGILVKGRYSASRVVGEVLCLIAGYSLQRGLGFTV